MDLDEFDEEVKGIAALDNPISRDTYQLVVEKGWVSRDEAAEALELARSVAAFHLEKLANSGLLKVRYERLTGRTGPGAGRPTKLYRRSDHEFDVSLPPRRYDLAGSLLADAIARAISAGTPIGEAVAQVAREKGESVGVQYAKPQGESAGVASLVEVLEGHGYEPKTKGQQITLLNCPFDSLAQQHRDLVCQMNFEFLDGLVEGIGESMRYETRLAPEAGFCCVRLDTR